MLTSNAISVIWSVSCIGSEKTYSSVCVRNMFWVTILCYVDLGVFTGPINNIKWPKERTLHLRIADRIFSRVSNRDSIETNSSTFMMEMKEISFMVRQRTQNSLVIVDELGRGTSIEDGSGICWAIAEELLKVGTIQYTIIYICTVLYVPEV